MSAPAIDLSRHHFMRPQGEFCLFGTWLHRLNATNDNESEPALVIVPRYRKNGFKPAVIALSAAYKYDSPQYCVRAAIEFIHAFGMTDSMATTHTLATLIHDHLLDLLKMPPSPTQSIIVGEAQIRDGSGTSRTVQVLDHDVLPQA